MADTAINGASATQITTAIGDFEAITRRSGAVMRMDSYLEQPGYFAALAA